MAENIGRKIRNIREAGGISPEELAQRTGISTDKLQEIESGKTQPSTAVVKKIVRALDIRLGTILDGSENRGVVVTRNQDKLKSIKSTSDGSYISESMDLYPLAPGKSDRQMEPFIVTLTEGKKSEYISQHEGEEFLYVLEGRVNIKYGNEEFDLQQGDSIYFNSLIPHHVSSSNGISRLLLVAYAPY